MSAFWRQAGAVCAKDLRSESRGWDGLTVMAVFALLVIVVFNFAFEPGGETRAAVAPGVLWAALLFAGIVGLERSFDQERDDGCLSGLLMSPADRGAVFLGKWAAAALLQAVLSAMVLPVFLLFFNAPLGGWLLPLAGTALLAAAGFAAVGVLLAALAGRSRMRHLLLPVLLLPLLVPLLIAAVEATAILMARAQGTAAADASAAGWLRLLAAFAVIYTAAGTLLHGQAVED